MRCWGRALWNVYQTGEGVKANRHQARNPAKIISKRYAECGDCGKIGNKVTMRTSGCGDCGAVYKHEELQ